MTNDQVDEWNIRDTAKILADLYRELDAAKHQGTVHREARVTRPRPGPQAPGNWLMISRDAELVDHLVEMVCDIRNHIAPTYTVGRKGEVLAEWVAFNAAAIAELDFADDLHDLMTTQVRRITAWLHPTGDSIRVREAAHAVERKFTAAEAASLASAATGQAVDRKQVTYWGRSGRITPYTQPDGTSAYLLGEVIDAAKGYRDDRKKSG